MSDLNIGDKVCIHAQPPDRMVSAMNLTLPGFPRTQILNGSVGIVDHIAYPAGLGFPAIYVRIGDKVGVYGRYELEKLDV